MGLGFRDSVGDGVTDEAVGSSVGPAVCVAYGDRVRMLFVRVV